MDEGSPSAFDGEDKPAQSPNSASTNPPEDMAAAPTDPRAVSEAPQEGACGVQSSTDDEPFAPLDGRLQTLCDTYHTSNTLAVSATPADMQHAKDFASVLLQCYYSTSEFTVEPVALGPHSAKGINFILKDPNEPASDPDLPPRKKQKRSARHNHTYYSYEAPWHHIEPENMAAVVVKKRVPVMLNGVETPTYRTHACLCIILDDLGTFRHWSRANVNHRGDVLVDYLGIMGGVERGHGMLLFGSRLELYNFDADNDTAPVSPYHDEQWRIDLCSTSIAAVDSVLRGFAEQEVVYQDEH